MYKISLMIITVFMLLSSLDAGLFGEVSSAATVARTPVEKYGQLSVKNGQLVDKAGKPVQLKGMSSHGIQWYGDFVNEKAMQSLRDDWGISVFRVAMYTESGGYISNPGLKKKVKEAVEAARKLGVYVIIDWHILSDYDPNKHKAKAKAFFGEMAGLYGKTPNVIYELANEPNGGVTWNGQIKPYIEEVSAVIRAKDPDNIIIAGTGTWSQDIHAAADNPVADANTMYALHFYAGTHGKALRDRIDYALRKKAPIFVSEWGTSDAQGSGGPFLNEAKVWIDFLDSRKISWVNWSLSDKVETSAALLPGASKTGNWPDSQLSPSGRFVKQELLDKSPVGNAGSGKPKQPSKPSQPSQPGKDKGNDTGNGKKDTAGIVLQYRNGDGNPSDNALKPVLNIVNTGQKAVSLSDLKIRYYFTDESKQKPQFFVDWAKIGGSSIRGAFTTMTTPSARADRYVELSFGKGAGSIPAGGESGDIQLRIHPADWSNYDETNDYSYAGTATSFKDWNRVTAYKNGTLVWGVEP
ncbi:cellulase family glycosylhydrolase [Paenibacillus sp. P96]|uniref:Endoglucanase n=1 Tax=Paenibacillus zeirhizosphaerae TaxID=2987519 RepID=A0ABT9FNB8_9BACL|nr:cellulase family glycosylhydrolase [Paenibacillus sp. P96]MDP4096229.1 cellulase family glycosylhydrolase [Paenibacillus sp. P96]